MWLEPFVFDGRSCAAALGMAGLNGDSGEVMEKLMLPTYLNFTFRQYTDDAPDECQ